MSIFLEYRVVRIDCRDMGLGLSSRCQIVLFSPEMKKLFRVFGWLGLATIALAIFALLYSTMKGYTTWYLRVDGVVTVDGQKTTGYLHANTNRTLLLVTRTDQGQPETYLVPLRNNEMIIDCGNWHPIRFLPLPIGDVNPPCSGYDVPTGVRDGPRSGTVVTSRRSVEFSTSSGRKIKAEW